MGSDKDSCKLSEVIHHRSEFMSKVMHVILLPLPDGFLRFMEADANERAMKRKKRREEATIFKNQGNEKFKMGNFLRAVELYTQGLERSKDFTILYTNRAQVRSTIRHARRQQQIVFLHKIITTVDSCNKNRP